MRNPDHLRLIPAFAREARALRRFYDQQFSDPRSTHAGRFVWDYWNVPGEYHLIRTPAYEYFPEAIYKKFHERLRQWGRETLGCHDVSPPWLSFYTDGCFQATHRDEPHGPWAFVYSLTDWEHRCFKGGETFLLSGKKKTRIAPQFNQLTVFDPAIAHGVEKVTGTVEPTEARIAIHGWFVNPRPFISGSLKPSSLQSRIEDLGEWLAQTGVQAQGWSVQKFKVNARGEVSAVHSLWSRLQSRDSQFSRKLLSEIESWNFGKQSGPSQVTLPLRFE